MGTLNLHTVIEVAEEVENDVVKAIADFHAALGKLGFKVADAKLTSDKGTKNITPNSAPVEPASDNPASDNTPEGTGEPTLDPAEV